MEPLIDASTLAALTGSTHAENLARRAAQVANEGNAALAAQLVEQSCNAQPTVPVLFLAFQFHFRTGNISRARDVALQRVKLAEQAADASQHARAWSNFGLAALWQQDIAAARSAAERAIALSNAANDPLSLSRDLALLAQVHEADKQWLAARDLYLHALALAEQTGEPARIATKLSNLGDVYMALGDSAAAAKCWHRALRLLAEVGKLRWHAECEAKLRALP